MLPLNHFLALINVYYILLYTQIKKLMHCFILKACGLILKLCISMYNLTISLLYHMFQILGIDDSPDSSRSV